jgi:hypothetical protein
VAALVAMATLALSGCGSSTQLVNMWKAPDLGPAHLRNVIVVSMRKDPATRRIWEDAFGVAISKAGATATPSYSIYPDRLPGQDKLRERVKDSGYDGILFVRPAGAREVDRYVPGYVTVRPRAYAGPFWDTYTVVHTRVYHPGYVERDRVVRLDITLWSTGDNSDLLWSATSRTLNPSSPSDLGREVSDRVVPELRRAGVL